ncbi:MAG: HDOD domain-containing protein [Verrucomicrobiales bacterium]|nr:HDOD domain-containing protein [Verrucomicrobiales bacterium]
MNATYGPIDLDDLITNANELAPLPASTVRLASLISRHDYDLHEAAEIVSYDQALTMKLLRAANSAAEAAESRITTADDAVFRLGAAQVLTLCVASSVGPIAQGAVPGYGLAEGGLWRHSVAAARASEALASACRTPIPPETFTAALLHDIGKLVMGRFLSAEILDWLDRARGIGFTALEAETQVLQVHHGELGGIIAQHWGLPMSIVHGIVHHHHPEEHPEVICDAVCLANLAAKRIEAPNAVITPQAGLLERLGLSAVELDELCDKSIARFDEVKGRFGVR